MNNTPDLITGFLLNIYGFCVIDMFDRKSRDMQYSQIISPVLPKLVPKRPGMTWWCKTFHQVPLKVIRSLRIWKDLVPPITEPLRDQTFDTYDIGH